VSPVKYKLVSYISEDDILHSDRRENLKSYIERAAIQIVTVVIVKLKVTASKQDKDYNI
jgi:hypothetical protein